MNSFYLTLTSDSSHALFPTNTTNRFRTELSSPIQFEGNWQVALCEIHCTNNWRLFPKETSFDVIFQNRSKSSDFFEGFSSAHSSTQMLHSSPIPKAKTNSSFGDGEPTIFSFSLQIETTNFRNVCTLCSYLSKIVSERMAEFDSSLQDLEDLEQLPVRFSLQNNTELVSIVSNKNLQVSLHPGNSIDLFRNLGFEGDSSVYFDMPIRASNPANLFGCHVVIYVLCNIVTYQHVGASQLPLLSMLPIKGRDSQNEIIHKVFSKPNYKSVNTSYFNVIEIELVNDDNTPLTFQNNSKVILSLHFRRNGL